MSARKLVTEDELVELERGLDRWHSCSPEVARKLVDEIRALRDALKVVWAQVDALREKIEKADVLHN